MLQLLGCFVSQMLVPRGEFFYLLFCLDFLNFHVNYGNSKCTKVLIIIFENPVSISSHCFLIESYQNPYFSVFNSIFWFNYFLVIAISGILCNYLKSLCCFITPYEVFNLCHELKICNYWCKLDFRIYYFSSIIIKYFLLS